MYTLLASRPNVIASTPVDARIQLEQPERVTTTNAYSYDITQKQYTFGLQVGTIMYTSATAARSQYTK